MPFWTYMLYCADRSFYVGHTDDLARRIAQHKQGTYLGYTSDKQPVTLVWSAEFPTREEARAAELRIKGWGRSKKLALIRSDWEMIQALARNSKEKGRASTGSAKPADEALPALMPGLPEPVEGLSFLSARPPNARARPPIFLHPHLRHRPDESYALEITFARTSDRLRLRYRLTGDLRRLSIAEPAAPQRRDELWRHTCFEAFIKPRDAHSYVEYNFAPSRAWAAYGFTSHRTGMSPLATDAPSITVSRDRFALELVAILTLPADMGTVHLNLTAILEAVNGTKSYWALSHPPAGPPDFHDPACFTLELPPPGEP